MVLHYLKKKENKDEILAREKYKKILVESDKFIKNNNFFVNKDYNTSFEVISLFLIVYINYNITNQTYKFKKINQLIVNLFISDLDESLRTLGIGDMSIGKYVKSYVKKFYFRIKKIESKNIEDSLKDYLLNFKLIKNNDIDYAFKCFKDAFKTIYIL